MAARVVRPPARLPQRECRIPASMTQVRQEFSCPQIGPGYHATWKEHPSGTRRPSRPSDPTSRKQRWNLTQQWVRRMRDGHRDERLPVEAFEAVDSGSQSLATRRKP